MTYQVTVDDVEWETVRQATWVNGSHKADSQEYCASATVSSGQAVFYLTDNGASNGNPIFTNVYKESANFWVDDAGIQYQYGTYTLSTDKKTLTVAVNKLGSVVLGLINIVSAANGVTVYMRVKGD